MAEPTPRAPPELRPPPGAPGPELDEPLEGYGSRVWPIFA